MGALPEGLLAFHDELKRELESTTDRGVVVLGASGLDTILTSLLEVSTVKSSKGVRASAFTDFASKVACAFLFGLISEQERRELTLIGRIRNRLAHEIDADIRSGPLRDLCAELKFCERHYLPSTIPFMTTTDGTRYIPDALPDPTALPDVQVAMSDPADPRERWVKSVKGLFECLSTRVALAESPSSPEEFKTDEPRRLVFESLERQMAEIRDRVGGLRVSLDGAEGPEKEEQLNELASIEDDIRRQSVIAAVGRYGLAVVQESRRRQRSK